MSDSSFTPNQVRARYAIIMPITLAGMAGLLLVAGWGFFVLKTNFGINVIGMEAARVRELKGSSNTVELVLAVLATGIAPILLWKAFTTRQLALHGAETSGRIVKVAMIRKHGSTPVTVEYMVGGVRYTSKKDEPSDGAEVGRAVRVIYDPRKPTRCFFIS